MGDDLVPDEITRLLGAVPTLAQIKGEKIVGPVSGQTRIARSGMWLLQTADRSPADMDGQIQEILSQTTNDLAVWQSLSKKYFTELFCGLMLEGTNEGIGLTPQSLVALGERGIELGLDIYAKRMPRP